MLLAALLLLGLVLLLVGGELLVRGASGLATAAGLSPLVVGLTVVAAATSAPELAVSVLAAREGAPGLAVGNVVGSNTVNVLLVLGLAALVAPLVVGRQVLRVDLPVAVGVGVLLLLLALDGEVGVVDGLLLLAVLVVYTARTVLVSRRATAAAAEDDAAPAGRGRTARDVVLLVVGVALLLGGSQVLVDAASTVAEQLGVSDLLVGLTVVAVGTSLPELAICVVGGLRGRTDLAVGNVVGSCVVNVGGVLGVTALVAGDGVPVDPGARAVDLPVMVAAVAGLLVLLAVRRGLGRRDGAVLLGAYLTYLGHLVVDATGSAAREEYARAAAVLGVVVLVTVAVSLVREVRRRAPQGAAPAT